MLRALGHFTDGYLRFISGLLFRGRMAGRSRGQRGRHFHFRSAGENRAVLLSHHGQLVAGKTIEEACNLAILIERAARLQLLAMAAGQIQPIPHELAKEAHDWVSTDKRNQVNSPITRKALKTIRTA